MEFLDCSTREESLECDLGSCTESADAQNLPGTTIVGCAVSSQLYDARYSRSFTVIFLPTSSAGLPSVSIGASDRPSVIMRSQDIETRVKADG